jgi:aspartate/methionine/tyrosine aminotransferase
LGLPDRYFEQLASEYQFRRDLLLEVLLASGLRPRTPEGSFFILTDVSGWGFENGRAFC